MTSIYLAFCQYFTKVYEKVTNYVRKYYLLMIQIKQLRKRIVAQRLTCILIVMHTSVIQMKNRCGCIELHRKFSCKPYCKLSLSVWVIKMSNCSWMDVQAPIEAPVGLFLGGGRVSYLVHSLFLYVFMHINSICITQSSILLYLVSANQYCVK